MPPQTVSIVHSPPLSNMVASADLCRTNPGIPVQSVSRDDHAFLKANPTDAVAPRLATAQSGFLFLEETMPKPNLSRMNVEALMDLRKRVDETLLQHRTKIRKQLERMDRAIGGARAARGGRLASGL